MRRVILESPYAGNLIQRFLNRRYARKCLRDSLMRDEYPFASHLLYPQALRPDTPTNRAMGMGAMMQWEPFADYVVVYIDRGVSQGMARSVNRHLGRGLKVRYRSLYGKMLHLKGDEHEATQATG